MQQRSTQLWALVTVFLLTALFAPAHPCYGAAAAVIYDEGKLTVRAFDRPLEEILRGLSEALDADIYVADECRHLFVTADVVSEPVDTALARVLRSVSYAATYRGGEADARISGLRVFPKGNADSPMTLVRRSDAMSTARPGAALTSIPGPSADPPERAMPPGALPEPGKTAVLLPQRPEHPASRSIAAVKAMEGLEKERALHDEIRTLEAELAGAGNEDVREALSVVLLEKIEEFHTLQKANRNMQAALRRLELFETQQATKADQ